MKENIPDFQTLMLPLMQLLRDNKEHPLPEVLDVMANKFALTEEELRIMVSSGQQTLFKNRVTWAISYLKNAGLIEYPKRAVYKITESGKSIFKEDLTAITTGYLKKFEAYRQWQSSLNQHQNITKPASELHETMTPEELIGDNFDKINDKLGTRLFIKCKYSCLRPLQLLLQPLHHLILLLQHPLIQSDLFFMPLPRFVAHETIFFTFLNPDSRLCVRLRHK